MQIRISCGHGTVPVRRLTEEAGGKGVHPGQVVNRSGASENEHGRHNDVRQEPEEEDSSLSELAPALVDDLGEGVGFRGVQFQSGVTMYPRQHVTQTQSQSKHFAAFWAKSIT